MGDNQFSLRRPIFYLPCRLGTHNMYVVLFNGPPRSGKDTLARMVADHFTSQHVDAPRIEHLAEPLRRIAYQMCDMTYGAPGALDYELFKTTWFAQFNRTGRQLLIDVSESFLKPQYGREIMANLLFERTVGIAEKVLLIPDSGFQAETNRLCSLYSGENVYVVNVMRNGCDFSNDSREWVSHPKASRLQMQVNNNGSLHDLATEAGRIYGRLVNLLGWVV